MLTFRELEDELLVGGKARYVKEAIQEIGGRWSKSYSSWVIPLFLDSEELRHCLQKDAEAAHKAVKKRSPRHSK